MEYWRVDSFGDGTSAYTLEMSNGRVDSFGDGTSAYTLEMSKRRVDSGIQGSDTDLAQCDAASMKMASETK